MHVCLLQPDSQFLCCVCISLCDIYLCRPTAHHESLTGRLLSQVCYIFSPNKGMCVYATWSIQWSIAKCIAVPRVDMEEWTWNQKALTKYSYASIVLWSVSVISEFTAQSSGFSFPFLPVHTHMHKQQGRLRFPLKFLGVLTVMLIVLYQVSLHIYCSTTNLACICVLRLSASQYQVCFPARMCLQRLVCW